MWKKEIFEILVCLLFLFFFDVTSQTNRFVSGAISGASAATLCLPADLSVLGIINEPTAAGLDKKKSGQHKDRNINVLILAWWRNL